MQILFALTLFLSAALLFVVQPMFAKMVLPLLGGTSAVWNTCMVFYQASLLAGYVYAHLSITWLGRRRQAIVHLPLMLVPWLVLPIGVAAGWMPPTDSNPIPWLLMLLAASVGLPFLFVSASAPMLQAWFAGTSHPSARDPYYLYAASNLGSMLGLLGYPFFFEPRLTLENQAWWWAAGYAALTGLTVVCALVLWRSPPGPAATANPPSPPEEKGPLPETPPVWTDRLWWLALSFAPSSLLLGVTTFITADLASFPLLWVVPLALYLMTFVLVFARWQILPHGLMLAAQPVLVVTAAAVFYVTGTGTGELTLAFALHLLTFFVTAMVCHGELARRRPASRHLTEFFLWMSLGGVLGGMFNALVAPLLFNDVYEYPLMIALACLLRPQPAEGTRRGMTWAWDFGIPMLFTAVFGFLAMGLNERNWIVTGLDWVRDRFPDSTPAWDGDAFAALAFLGVAALGALAMVGRPVRFGLGVFGLLAVSLLYNHEGRRLLHAERSFFGVLRVEEITYDEDDEVDYTTHRLMHGSTNHGVQCWDPPYQQRPWSYYFPSGPVGMMFEAAREKGDLEEIGVVGLGTGTIAAYGEPGQRITYFEIDPAVVRIARDPRLFRYLTDSKAEIDIQLGDARLTLAQLTDRRFDLLFVDAFSSDAIPVHLLTREALQLYLDRLSGDGILAVHISNRHLELEPVLGNLAKDLGLAALVCDDDDEGEKGKYGSTWVALARQYDDLGSLAFDPVWKDLVTAPDKRLWTDNYSNVLDVLDLQWRDIPWAGRFVPDPADEESE